MAQIVSPLRAVMPILIGASVMLTLAMGLRQSLGLFMPALTTDISVSITQFTFAIAIQNLVWGLCQPFVGALVPRFGYRAVMVAGSVLYIAGMALLASANGVLSVMLGAGVLIGIAMACASMAMAMAVASSVAPPAIRSTILGFVSAAGSIGTLLAAPIGQLLLSAFDWRVGVAGFAVLALAMLPSAWIAGRADRIAPPPPNPDSADAMSARGALGFALGRPGFVIMTCAYFVCGMQLVFLTTHLPSYLLLCGMDPMLSASALGVIGGFNVLGSLFFGWAGGRWSKPGLLGLIYVSRSIVLAAYFIMPPTPESTILFAAVMGFLWLGVGPLVAGSIAETFGLRWLPMLQGVMFLTHQLGSFVGAFGGGWVFDALGSYDLALQVGVSMGLTAGLIQIAAAWRRPPRTLSPA
jgi:predicted MFS family arabinose efflux permease